MRVIKSLGICFEGVFECLDWWVMGGICVLLCGFSKLYYWRCSTTKAIWIGSIYMLLAQF